MSFGSNVSFGFGNTRDLEENRESGNFDDTFSRVADIVERTFQPFNEALTAGLDGVDSLEKNNL